MADNDTKLEKILKRLRYASRAVAEWNTVAEEDINFALGEQWTEDEKKILQEQGRPCLTFNKLGVQIKVVEGHQRLNAPRIKVSPEGGEDKYFSEAVDKALTNIGKVSKLDMKLNEQFRAGIIPGKAWLEMAIDYDKDPVYGELKFILPEIKSVLKDPDGKEYDLSDSDYLFKLTKYTKERLKSLFPKKKALIEQFAKDNEVFDDNGIIKEGDDDNYGLRPSTVDTTPGTDEAELEEDVKFTLIEYYYRKYINKYFLFNFATKGMEQYDTEEEAQAEKDRREGEQRQKEQIVAGLGLTERDATTGQMAGMPTQPAEQYKILEREVPEMWLCQISNKRILNEDKSPFEPHYNGFPFFPFYAEYNYFAKNEKLRVKGIIRDLKDPQKEVNKSRSQFLHALNTSLNSGWIIDEGAISLEKEKELGDFGGKPGLILKAAVGKRVERIQPVAPDMAQMMREKAATENMKEISGINPDLLALEDKTTSGRALSVRIKQGLTILAGTFSNFKYTKELLGVAILKLLPSLLDAPKWARIMGGKWVETSKVDEAMLNAYLTQIKDYKYDISVADSTIKTETFEQLMELVEKGASIPIDLLLEYSDIPNSGDVIAKVKQAQQVQTPPPGAPGR